MGNVGQSKSLCDVNIMNTVGLLGMVLGPMTDMASSAGVGRWWVWQLGSRERSMGALQWVSMQLAHFETRKMLLYYFYTQNPS